MDLVSACAGFCVVVLKKEAVSVVGFSTFARQPPVCLGCDFLFHRYYAVGVCASGPGDHEPDVVCSVGFQLG